jgi:SAM-dependent methyltransferase
MGTGFSFEVVNADDYDALRPDYAPEAVAWVAERAALGAGSLVVDLAAGTGQLSRRFAPLGVDVVAVEPAENMRAVIAARLPGVRSIAGTAEAIPLPEGSVDTVVVGNAFHHFDAERAFADIARVLRPAGALALFWAWQADGEPLRHHAIAEIDDVVERTRSSRPIVAAYRRWADPPARVGGFSAFERRSFPTTHVLPSSRLADLYATSSDVASLPEDERAELLGRVREMSRDLPETIELPSRTVVDLCRREGPER